MKQHILERSCQKFLMTMVLILTTIESETLTFDWKCFVYISFSTNKIPTKGSQTIHTNRVKI